MKQDMTVDRMNPKQPKPTWRPRQRPLKWLPAVFHNAETALFIAPLSNVACAGTSPETAKISL